MKNMMTEPREIKDRMVTDSNGQEIGRVREVEQEARTGRYSTLHIEVDARNTQRVGTSGWHHLPLNTSDTVMERESIRARQTIENLNSQFMDKVTIRKALHNPAEFIDRPVRDMNGAALGIAKDVGASSGNGEFATLLVELDVGVRKDMALGAVDHVRIRLDRVQSVGQDIVLDSRIESLGREWNEIILHR